jgi:hypothetical protein
MAGIRVANESGGNATFSQALMRNILRLVDGLVFYIVGIILILNSDKKQRLGDRVAGTVVLHTHKIERHPQGGRTEIQHQVLDGRQSGFHRLIMMGDAGKIEGAGTGQANRRFEDMGKANAECSE